VSKLNHRNIVALFATVCEPGHYGIVMEFVLHGALDEYILSNDVCCSPTDSYKPVHLCIFSLVMGIKCLYSIVDKLCFVQYF